MASATSSRISISHFSHISTRKASTPTISTDLQVRKHMAGGTAMRRWWQVMMIVAFAVMMPWVGASGADTFTVVDGLRFKVFANKAAYVVAPDKDESYAGDIVIPSEIPWNDGTIPVEMLDKECFSGQSGITSVTVPASVTTLVEGCFDNLTLENLTLCDGETSLTIKRSSGSGMAKIMKSGSVKEVYIGRNLSSQYCYMFAYTSIGKITWSPAIRTVSKIL